MRLKNVFGILLSLLTLVMLGCGDDGGTSTTVSGTVAAGAVSGGTVTFNSIDATGVVGAQLSTTPTPVTTAADGTYTATIGYAGPLLVTVTGGTYLDEATGQIVTLTTPLRAALPNATGTVVGNVTPFTELAVQEAGPLTAANITSANTAISSLINVPDILVTAPAGPAANPAYVSALQTISQVQVDTGADLATTIATLAAGITINTATNTATIDPATQAVIDTAETNVANSPNIQLTAVTLSAAPAGGVTTSPTPVTITAAVTFVSSGLPVPAGANVNFSITSGTGTLSAASAVTTAGGSASVTLSSTTVGNVVVSAATATSAAVTLTVSFIDDPNVPGAVTIAASPASTFVNQPVTITATVAPAGAGGVIANGTVVTFASTFGTFSAVTTTTGGVATATFTSATAGTASITASAAGVSSAPISVVVGAQPILAVVTVATSGTLPAGTLIGGVDADLTYAPTTFTIVDTDVNFAGPGLGLGTLPIANTTTAGQVTLGLINAGLGNNVINATGAFATLNFHVPVGTFTAPTLAIAAGATVIDTNGLAIPGITVVIQSVTLQ